MSKGKFFAYDPEDGFDFFETEQEARDKCQRNFEDHRIYAADSGWSEQITDVCWGRVVESVVETGRSIPKGVTVDEDGIGSDGNYYGHFGGRDELVHHELKPVGPATEEEGGA